MDLDLLREVVAAIPPGAWMSYGDVAARRAAAPTATPARSTSASSARRRRAPTAS